MMNALKQSHQQALNEADDKIFPFEHHDERVDDEDGL